MRMQILEIFCAAITITRAQVEEFPRDPHELLKSKDSIIFTQFDEDEERSFIEYAPADPDEQNINFDGTLNSTAIIYSPEEFSDEYWGICASYDAQKVWFNNIRRQTIIEYDVANDDVRTVTDDLTDGLQDLTYDRVTKILYWTDSIQKIIMAINTSSYRHFSKIWTSDGVSPHGLTLHTTKRKLFFSVYNTQIRSLSKSAIIKCDLDGSNTQTILRFPDVLIPRGITIDFAGDKLFWTDISFLSTQSVVMASDLEGKRKRQFFAAPSGFLWDIVNYKNFMYITDMVNTTMNEYSIYIREKSGRRGKIVKTKLRPRSIDIYAPNEVSNIKIPNTCNRARCEHLCLAHTGGYTCKCSPGYKLVLGYKCVTNVLDDDYLLVSDIGQKRVFQLSLKTSAYLVDEIIALPWDDKTKEKIYAAAVDHKNGDMAWYDLENKQIVWGNRTISYLDAVSSIAVHCCKDEIFWAGNFELLYWNGTSTNYESMYIIPFFSDSDIRQISIDCFRGHLYWVEYDKIAKKAEVKRSDTRGENVEVVLTNLPPTKGLTIDYETYTLYVMTMLEGILYSLKLKLLENIPDTSPLYYEYESTDLSRSFRSKVTVIWDIRVKNGMVYLADSEHPHIRRYDIRKGLSSMEDYGPKFFFFTPTIDFYHKQHYDTFIEKSCPEYTTTTTTSTTTTTTATTTAPTPATSSIISAKTCVKLLSGTDDINEGLKLFFLCLFGQKNLG